MIAEVHVILPRAPVSVLDCNNRDIFQREVTGRLTANGKENGDRC